MDLRPLLHSSEAALHTPNRLMTTCWIENAAVVGAGGSTVVLRLCCLWSCEAVEVHVDLDSGIAFLGPGISGGHDKEGMKALDGFLEKYNEEMLVLANATSPSAATTTTASPIAAATGTGGAGLTKVGRLLRRLRSQAHVIWPSVVVPPRFKEPAATRASLLADISLYLQSSSASSSTLSSLLSGLLLTCTLMSNASYSTKAHFSANPLPPFFEGEPRITRDHEILEGDLVGTGAGSGSMSLSLSQARPRPQEDKQKMLQEALSEVFPFVTRMAAADSSTAGRSLLLLLLLLSEGGGGAAGDLSLLSLYFLHWLLILAPVRLMKRDGEAGAGGAGKLPLASKSAASGPGGQGGGQGKWSYYSLLHGAGDFSLLPSAASSLPWDVASHQRYGEYRHGSSSSSSSSSPRAPCYYWYHGTDSELAFTILQRGLRNMSGTHREANGSMLGKGIYLSNDPQVCLEFASSTGQHLPFLSPTPTPTPTIAASSTPLPATSSPAKKTPAKTPAAIPSFLAGTVPVPVPVRSRLRVVLECRAIANPSTNEIYRQGTEVGKALHQVAEAARGTAGRAGGGGGGGGGGGVVPPASSYLVVKDGGSLAITGLYLCEGDWGTQPGTTTTTTAAAATASASPGNRLVALLWNATLGLCIKFFYRQHGDEEFTFAGTFTSSVIVAGLLAVAFKLLMMTMRWAESKSGGGGSPGPSVSPGPAPLG